MDGLEFKIGQLMDPSFAGLKPKELQINLEGSAVKVIETDYTRNLTNDELGISKSQLAEIAIKIAAIERRKKEVMDDFKQELKDPKREYTAFLEMIQNKSVRKTGVLYLIPDFEKGMMYSFDKEAICVDARPLSSQERQLSIQDGVHRLNTGTSDENGSY